MNLSVGHPPIGGFIGALPTGSFGAASLGLTVDGGIAVFRIVAIALALVAEMLSGVAVTIARNYPGIGLATRLNALLGFVIIAIAAGEVLGAILFAPRQSTALVYGLYTVLLGIAVAMVWNTNRQGLRARG